MPHAARISGNGVHAMASVAVSSTAASRHHPGEPPDAHPTPPSGCARDRRGPQNPTNAEHADYLKATRTSYDAIASADADRYSDCPADSPLWTAPW